MSFAAERERRQPLDRHARQTATALLVVLCAALAAILLQCSATKPSPTPPSTGPPPQMAVSPSATAAGPVAWTGDFEDGLSGWEPRSAAADRIQVYTAGSPVAPAPRQGRYAARLTASNDDFRSPNVRAQLDGTFAAREGDDLFWRYSVFFPTDFPVTAGIDPAFFTFAEFMGAPYDGPSAFGNVSVVGDAAGRQSIAWVRGAEKGFDRPWSVPLERGRWHDFVFHVVFSSDSSRGSVQLWYDGKLQSLAGTTSLHMQTIRRENAEGLSPVLTNYRTADSVPGEVTIYVDAATLGRSLADVGGPGGP